MMPSVFKQIIQAAFYLLLKGGKTPSMLHLDRVSMLCLMEWQLASLDKLYQDLPTSWQGQAHSDLRRDQEQIFVEGQAALMFSLLLPLHQHLGN
jgi:hypothetical protein